MPCFTDAQNFFGSSVLSDLEPLNHAWHCACRSLVTGLFIMVPSHVSHPLLCCCQQTSQPQQGVHAVNEPHSWGLPPVPPFKEIIKSGPRLYKTLSQPFPARLSLCSPVLGPNSWIKLECFLFKKRSISCMQPIKPSYLIISRSWLLGSCLMVDPLDTPDPSVEFLVLISMS